MIEYTKLSFHIKFYFISNLMRNINNVYVKITFTGSSSTRGGLCFDRKFDCRKEICEFPFTAREECAKTCGFCGDDGASTSPTSSSRLGTAFGKSLCIYLGLGDMMVLLFYITYSNIIIKTLTVRRHILNF